MLYRKWLLARYRFLNFISCRRQDALIQKLWYLLHPLSLKLPWSDQIISYSSNFESLTSYSIVSFWNSFLKARAFMFSVSTLELLLKAETWAAIEFSMFINPDSPIWHLSLSIGWIAAHYAVFSCSVQCLRRCAKEVYGIPFDLDTYCTFNFKLQRQSTHLSSNCSVTCVFKQTAVCKQLIGHDSWVISRRIV